MHFFPRQASNDRFFADARPPSTVLAIDSVHPTFAACAEQVYVNERARVERGELSRDSLLVLRNRLDKHVLPCLGALPISAIDYPVLLDFVQKISQDKSTTTVSQYLVILRKVLTYARRMKSIVALPEFPVVKVTTTPRGAFTPSEYWRILRATRRLSGQKHPLSARALRVRYKLCHADRFMPPDLAWVIGFMVHSFIRPGDLKTLRHRHVEQVRQGPYIYLRLTLPQTKLHAHPIVTLYPAVRIYREIIRQPGRLCRPDDYLFLPHLRDRNYALGLLGVMFNWVLDALGLKLGPHGQPRTLYSLRHSAITFRLLYGHGIDLLTLARNARTSVEVITQHYASTLTAEQNIALLQSRRGAPVRY